MGKGEGTCLFLVVILINMLCMKLIISGRISLRDKLSGSFLSRLCLIASILYCFSAGPLSACSFPKRYKLVDLKRAETVFVGQVVKIETIETPEYFLYPERPGRDKEMLSNEMFRSLYGDTVKVISYSVFRTYKGKHKDIQKRVMYIRKEEEKTIFRAIRRILEIKKFTDLPKVGEKYILGANQKKRNKYKNTLEYVDSSCTGSLVFSATTSAMRNVENIFQID